MSKHNRIPGGLSPVCCEARRRRAGGGRPVVPVPRVPVERSSAPRYLFGFRRPRLLAVLAVVYGLLAVWWFAPAPVASVAAGFAVLGFGWLLAAELFSSPGGVR